MFPGPQDYAGPPETPIPLERAQLALSKSVPKHTARACREEQKLRRRLALFCTRHPSEAARRRSVENGGTARRERACDFALEGGDVPSRTRSTAQQRAECRAAVSELQAQPRSCARRHLHPRCVRGGALTGPALARHAPKRHKNAVPPRTRRPRRRRPRFSFFGGSSSRGKSGAAPSAGSRTTRFCLAPLLRTTTWRCPFPWAASAIARIA